MGLQSVPVLFSLETRGIIRHYLKHHIVSAAGDKHPNPCKGLFGNAREFREGLAPFVSISYMGALDLRGVGGV